MPHPSDPYPSEAEALRQAASDGFAALQIAHLRYEHALETVADAGATGQAFVDIREQGREYAEAVTRYSKAAMAWLAFADLRGARKSARKAKSGG
jgi:hypothetical protein